MEIECPQCHKPRTLKKKPKSPDVICRDCKAKNTPKRRAEDLTRTCSKCGNIKKVKSHRETESTVCRDCYDKEDKIEKKRICIDCGDIKKCLTERDAKALRCKVCSAKEVASRRIGTTHKAPKIRYWYFCKECSKVQKRRVQHRTMYCQDCSRKQPNKKYRVPAPYFNFTEMKMIVPKPRYFRICPHCPENDNIKQVRREVLAGIKPCQKHKYVDKQEALKEKEAKRLKTYNKTVKERKPKPKAKPRIKKGELSPKAIEKIREINREHRKILKEEKKKPILQKKTDEEMLKEFYKTKKPSVQFTDEPIKHAPIQRAGSGTSVMN